MAVISGWRLDGKLCLPGAFWAAIWAECGRRSGEHLRRQRLGDELLAAKCDWQSIAGLLRNNTNRQTRFERILRVQPERVCDSKWIVWKYGQDAVPGALLQQPGLLPREGHAAV